MKQIKSNYDLQVDIAKGLFLKFDQETLIRKFCLAADANWIYLNYLNTPCRISRGDGSIEEYIQGQWKLCRSFETVMTIYDLLCYPQGAVAPVLFGQWCAVGTFIITGVQETGTFTKKYAALFDGRVEELKSACETLGGELQPSMAGADVTCRIPVTPFFPVLLQFWQGDEDFPPKLMLMWDRNTEAFLHFETTFYLQGDLLQRLKRTLEAEVS